MSEEVDIAETRSPRAHARPSFPVVAVGVGAGGLDALALLLRGFEACGSSLVVVIGGAAQAGKPPPGFAELAGQVRAATDLEVVEIAGGMPLLADRVYLSPPDVDVAVYHGAFHVLPPIARSGVPRLAIDFFMRSLAAENGPSAIGVLLGDGGVDGAYGLEAIRAEGGVTLVPNGGAAAEGSGSRRGPARAESDLVVPPTRLAGELAKLSAHPYLAAPRLRVPLRSAPGRRRPPEELAGLFVQIRAAYGTDFKHYKPTTIERRIERRMVLHRLERNADYASLVKERPQELDALYRDCLIGVTTFFRDHEPFRVLETSIFSHVLARKPRGAPIRVWVPGCSTGEEAYSIAILLFERFDRNLRDGEIQIFASDLDEDAIRRGRRGVYPAHIALDVSPARLERFFVRLEDGRYQIARRLRDLVIFARQDLTRDPPYSHVDLVSCRNLLIYLQASVQKRVLRSFHYALNADGALLLGNSETIGDAADLFAIGDKQQKIYFKRNLPAPAVFDVISDLRSGAASELPPRIPSEVRSAMSIQQLADRKILEKYGPPGVLVNDNLDILQFRGRVGAYLEPMPGIASLNLMKLIRPELMVELRAALERARIEHQPASVRGPSPLEGAAPRLLDLEVIPIDDPESQSRCYLVLFREAPVDAGESPLPIEVPPGERRARELERQLQATKEYLQTTIEELESANEELQSSNEELQSTNEELQSTNEEIETSKEELQSTNEELSMVNDELQTRMRELSAANDDLQNVLATTLDAVVIVGSDLKIRRFSRAAALLLRLDDADVGLPVSSLRRAIPDFDFEGFIVDAVDHMAERREEVIGSERRWYSVRVAPYRTGGHAINGAVLTFVDIHDDRRRAELIQRINRHAVNVLSALRGALVVVDGDQRVVWANHRFHELFATTDDETLGNLFHNLGNGQWAHPKLRAHLGRALADGTPFADFVIAHDFERIGGRTVHISGSRILDEDDAPLVLLSIEEVDGEPRKSS